MIQPDRRKSSVAFVLLAGVVSSIGCASSEADSLEAQQWLRAQATRDTSVLWAMLCPRDQAAVKDYYTDLTALDEAIQTFYPEADVASARTRTQIEFLDEVQNERDLFGVFIARTGSASRLSRFQEFGLRSTARTEGEDGITVRTLGGDSVAFTIVDGAHRAQLSDEDRMRIAALRSTAQNMRQSLLQRIEDRKKKRL